MFFSKSLASKLFKSFSPSVFFVGALLLCFFSSLTTKGIHIKAGEITLRNVGATTRYEITLTLYFDSTNIANEPQLRENEALIDFGDGSAPRSVPVNGVYNAGNNTTKKVYITTYDFRFQNSYTISYSQQNRNQDIVNINGKEGSKDSDNFAFYVETQIFIDNTLGPVSSPILTFPPIDNATPGQIFTHNPGADPINIGDSISYELTVPRQKRDQTVPKYISPADAQYNGQSVGGTPATIVLNPTTGDLIWDTPSDFTSPGVDYALYNVAIKVIQWRKLNNGRYVAISYIVRDMQIKVEKLENKRPELKLPNDTCLRITANTILNKTIYAWDPDSIAPNKQKIILNVFSEIIPPATFLLDSPFNRNPISNPGSGQFSWQPGCNDVRTRPYIVTFKAEDNVAPNIRLATYKSWSIKVFGDKPSGLQATIAGTRTIGLSWDKYLCNNIDSILIYRKDCNESTFIPNDCDPLNLASQGFVKIGSTAGSGTTYADSKNIIPGSYYCYIIVARFPGGIGTVKYIDGLSFASDEVCLGFFNETVLFTNVSILNTDAANGKVAVGWRNGFKTDSLSTYKFDLLRSNNGKNGNYNLVYSTTNSFDSTFVDSIPPLNTDDRSLFYVMNVYKNNALSITTDTISSVFLTAIASNNRVDLSWSYQVPWDNSKYKHYIYRRINSEQNFKLIDSVAVTASAKSYADLTISNKDTFCYYVETRGIYCFKNLTPILLNNSQIECGIVRDSTPPCPPVLSLKDEDCSTPVSSALSKPFKNYLNWVLSSDLSCNSEVVGFNLYFAEHDGDDFKLIRKFPKDSLSFIDENFFSQAGCYAVTAFNFYGIESVKSNIECNDNCVYYELPNLLTLNNDTLNNIFRPFNYPRGVAKVQLYVYNRWGALVHYTDNDIFLNWQPRIEGSFSDGVYYYLAKITYERRRFAKDENREIKGWVQIISNTTPLIR